MSRSKSPSELRIAVDTGGTFTDCVWVEDGRLRMLKVFSTPQDPSRAIVEALQKTWGSSLPGPALVLLHGTTVGTNTLLQRKGARVAFVTTKGFADTIEIGRQARPKLYDFFFDKVEPLVPPELRFGVEERIGPEGEVVRELRDLVQLKNKVRGARPEAIAISLLFSFANPDHERKVAEALQELNVPLSVSHELLPEFREYERASTVVVNAYLQPVMESYLRGLARAVSQQSRVFVMQSSGGITSLEIAAREPVRTVLSGPAGGVVGAAAMARLSGFQKIIGFDMGGTSTDVCLVDGEAKATNEGEVAGLPVRVPMLDIHTVGAGGGSIARFDAAGALRVGPESAGADPGPICYGRGEQPTVTDANLLLGRLQPDAFLGGEFKLDLERARDVVSKWLQQSGSRLSVQRFAEGVVRVVNATMERGIRVVSIERGYDTRDFALVAFGGAGGLHACELAQSLKIPTVIVPAMPGALSAYGILVSDIVKDYSRTILLRVRKTVPKARLEGEFLALSNWARREFQEEGWSGKPELLRSADIRYRGQGYELNIAYGPSLLGDFHAEHKRRYGYNSPEREVEIVTVRLRARVRGAIGKRPKMEPAAVVTASNRSSRLACVARGRLGKGRRQSGPAVITEYSATTFVPSGWVARVDDVQNLILRSK
jgi:N-methylhydantoinase A